MKFLSNLLASTLGSLLALGVLVLFFVLLVTAIAASTDSTPSVADASVLVISLDHAIPERSVKDPFMKAFDDSPQYDLRDFSLAIEKAAADDRIEAIWLKVQGGSGAWATIEEVRQSLLRFRESGKPIIASGDDSSMDEAAYYLASTADSVFAPPQAMFEFNGFYIAAQFYQELLQKIEVEPQVVRAGKYKSAIEPFTRRDLSPENEEQMTSLLQSWNSVFLQAIAESRGMTPEAVAQIASDAAIFTSQGAYEAGLLDGLLFNDQVVDVFRNRLGMEDDDDLNTVYLADYVDVPASEAGIKSGNDGDIAIVYAVGTINSGESGYSPNPLMGGDVVGAETFNEAMKEARENDRVKAIVLRVNSPGGSAPAADAMWREIQMTADVKPLIVSMGDYAASGGYWISTPADTIVAQPLTLTGSIGVFSVFFNTGELMRDKLGITYDVVSTSPYADMFSGIRPLSPAEADLLSRSVQGTYHAFLQNVSRGRGLTEAQVDSIGQGRVWTGAQAKEIGLVDVLGGIDTAVAIAAEKAGLAPGSYHVRTLPHEKTFIERLSQSFETRVQSSIQRFTLSPLERAVLAQYHTATELINEQGTVQARIPALIDVR